MNDTTHFATLQLQLAEKLGIEINAIDAEQLSEQLASMINHLILNDMNKLVFILYRVDIAEEKVLKIIHENSIPEAGQLLAEALISRQIQKLKSRASQGSSPDIPEDEKW